MSGIIGQRSCNYGHGIISQDCFAKEYTDTGFQIKLVCTGTFVQVHSVRDDDVLFCIVRDDMQVEMNKMVCKKVDIINVPENLWGPLFTVEKLARLPLVEDSKVAESIGNISVGDTVQVLGPENSIICIGNVTFRNYIGRLGVGIYFGLQVLNPKESLQRIIEKVSLLGPGTKGFPRGCDIVVTIDKIRPNSWSSTGEKSARNCDKEYPKHLMKSLSNANDPQSKSLKPGVACNFKEKHTTDCKKKDLQASSLDTKTGLKDPCFKEMIHFENLLNIGDRVVYLNGDEPEKGVVKWIGLIENSVKVGVELDNPVGSGTGTVDGLGELFKTKYQHALIVPPMALIRLCDYEVNSSKEMIHSNTNCSSGSNSSSSSRSSSCSNNNYYYNYNNNNNHNKNNNNKDDDDDDDIKNTNSINRNNNNNNFSQCNITMKTNYNNIHNNNNTNYNNNNIYNNNNNSSNHNGSNNNNNYNSGGNFKSSDDYWSLKEFFCERKLNSEDSCKKSKRILIPHQCLKHNDRIFELNDDLPTIHHDNVFNGKELLKSEPEFEKQHNLKSFDSSRASERKMSYKKNFNSIDNSLVQKESNLIASGQSVSCWNRSGHDSCDLGGTKQEKIRFSHCCGDNNLQKCNDSGDNLVYHKSAPSNHPKVIGTIRLQSYENMTRKSFDNPYIPLTVLEQSFSAKKLESEGDALYDVPPSIVRRVASFPEALVYYKEKWGSHCAEHSSSDENLPSFALEPSRGFSSEDLGVGSVVELTFKGESHFGVIRWIGTLSIEGEGCSPRLIAGIEMEEECTGFSDGTFNSKRYFQCNPGKALFVPLSKCRKDSRFLEESQKQNLSSKVNYGQLDCPIVEGMIPPVNIKGDLESLCGKNRGIQGHHNSCYLDATLFSMFAFTSVFDSLLYRPPTKNDIPQYSEVQKVLRDEIVNPLRKNLYVRADRVMKLRTLLEKLSSVSGLTSEEKDPEEFLNSLLAQILKAEPFLKLNSGQEAFHYQLFVEKDERLVLPSVQQLFEQSFVTSDIKLRQIPSCLIIQMPRFGKSFKMYSRILPPQLLDITDIIENSPRQCTVCGNLAEFECKDCFGQQGIGNELESISFCKTCLDTVHSHHCRSRHNSRTLTVPVEFYELQEHCVIPRLYMELFAVVCIETSHYVAFVKCGSGSDAPWCFFDSMADRKGEQNGYNIPEMVPCPDLPYWLSEEGTKTLNEIRDERHLPEYAKRLFSDAYMCMYQSPDLMMYR